MLSVVPSSSLQWQGVAVSRLTGPIRVIWELNRRILEKKGKLAHIVDVMSCVLVNLRSLIQTLGVQECWLACTQCRGKELYYSLLFPFKCILMVILLYFYSSNTFEHTHFTCKGALRPKYLWEWNPCSANAFQWEWKCYLSKSTKVLPSKYT